MYVKHCEFGSVHVVKGGVCRRGDLCKGFTR